MRLSLLVLVLLPLSAFGGSLGPEDHMWSWVTNEAADAPTLSSIDGTDRHTYSVPDASASTESEAAAPADLLERMRQGFTLPIESHARTDAQRNWYVRHPEYLNRVFDRSRPYLHFIVSEIAGRGMPLELALLPIVESAFDPFAYSHGRAAGLWQIIPGTGRRFGLSQNWWYDGRRDVLASTRAALDYLEFLAKRYDGDYELAVAAYNSGEGTVDRAIRRNRKAGKPTTFWDLKLPRETSSYVPKLLALADIVGRPSRFELSLPVIQDERQLAVVQTGGQIDLALAAELAAIDIDALYRLNPGYNQWATAPDGPHTLVVPATQEAQFLTALDALPDNQRMRWQRHKIREGQSLSEIAEQYNVTVKTLQQTNQLSGTMIRAGQHLLVPTASAPRDSYALSASARLSRQQNRTRDGVRVEHLVKPGESFWTIAKQYSVGTRELAKWNNMAPRDTLAVGKKLVIWTKKPGGSPVARSTTTRKLYYTVRNGDSLARIASRFRVRVKDLVQWNNLDIDRYLRPGQKLTMFVDVTRQSS